MGAGRQTGEFVPPVGVQLSSDPRKASNAPYVSGQFGGAARVKSPNSPAALREAEEEWNARSGERGDDRSRPADHLASQN
jgi:hypothetical protein